MRVGKRALVTYAAAIAAAVVIGGLAGRAAGPLAGILTALAALAAGVLLQAAANLHGRDRSSQELLETAARELAPPHEEPIEGDVGGLSLAGLLRADAQVVEFWPRPELDALRRWLVADRPVGVWLVTGDGGTGKTRLALQLTSEATREYGWQCYWLTDRDQTQAAQTQAVSAARQGGRPALVVVDYAETQPGLAGLLGGLLAGEPGPVTRVLLLARSAGEWWAQLQAESTAPVGDLLTATEPLQLAPLADPARQQEVFAQAVAAFAARLGTDPPLAPQMPALPPGAPVLVVHATALLGVLDRQSCGAIGELPGSAGEVIAGLLRHERRYWQHSLARYGLKPLPAVTDRVVAAGTLAGADDEDAATALLAAVGGLGGQAERTRAALWLHDLYPTEAGGGEWIGPLRPDLVAEHLITTVLADQPGLARALLAGLTRQRVTRALTILARAALTDLAAIGVIRRLLESNVAHLAVPALTVAVETNPAVGDLLADALQGQQWPTELAQAIAEALPRTSVALARTSVIAYQRLAEATAADGEKHSENLVHLSDALADLGRREDALHAINQAVTTYRRLAVSRPEAVLSDLAKALTRQSGRLADLERREDALAAIKQAVTIYRQITDAQRKTTLPSLSMALTNEAACLAELGRREDALAAIDEAVAIYSELVNGQPETFGPGLAMALANQSNCLSDLGRREEALDAIDGAITIFRRLAEARPDAFLPDLAMALHNQSLRRADVGRRKDALIAIEQACIIYRQLAETRRDAFLPRLARALNSKSSRLASLGRRDDALAAIELAVVIFRQLADMRAEVFLPDLASALSNRSSCLADLGRRRDALAAIEQAVAIYRQLTTVQRGAFLPDFAWALSNRSGCLFGVGRRRDALAAIEQAVVIYRQLAEAQPDAFLPSLAIALHNQSLCLAGLGRSRDALAAVELAIAIYRQLVGEQPETFLPNFAMALGNQCDRLAVLGRGQDALVAVEQAVAIYRQLADEQPEAFLPDLASALNLQSLCLSSLGRGEDALDVIKQAVTIRRGLNADNPAIYATSLRSSLKGMAEILASLGRDSDAESARAEAEQL